MRARISRTSKGTRTSTEAMPISSSAGYSGGFGRGDRIRAQALPVEVADDAPGDAQRLVLVMGQVVAQPGGAGVHERPHPAPPRRRPRRWPSSPAVGPPRNTRARPSTMTV